MASTGFQDGDKTLRKSSSGFSRTSLSEARIDTMPKSLLGSRSLLFDDSASLESGISGNGGGGGNPGAGGSYGRSSGTIQTVFPQGKYSGMVNHAGKPNGRGVMRFNDGSVYDGEWQNSVMDGEGVCTYADGVTEYKGMWKSGNPHGSGCFVYSNGDRYDGEWKNGKMDGRGVYSFQNSEIYDGEWRLNKHHGHGRFTYKSGNIYDGQWRCGKREENGIFKYANGDEFAGEYCDDKRDGLGVYRRANGELDIKVYSDDCPSEGVRYSGDRKKAWNVKSDSTCTVTTIKEAEVFRENTSIISPFLAHYLDKYI